MQARVLLILSIALNLMLAGGWLLSRRAAPAPASGADGVASGGSGTNRLIPVYRRQFFSWSEIESDDYRKFIANLREIGCPEQTIRDIIAADVQQMFAARRLAELPRLKPHPWWTNRSGNDGSTNRIARANELSQEQEALLVQLLGPDWNTVRRMAEIEAGRDFLDGIGFGDLPEDVRSNLLVILQSDEARGALNGVNMDLVTAQAVNAEKGIWARLTGLLTPAQLDLMRLHLSPNADSLRDELDALPGFEIKPDEFRRLFNATDALDHELRSLGEAADAVSQQRREKLVQQRESAMRAALGEQRYDLFAKVRDPDYMAALEILHNANGNPKALQTLYAIRREAAMEELRIAGDSKLTETQRDIELKRVELEQLKATARALGETVTEEPKPAATPRPIPAKTHVLAGAETLDAVARIHGVNPGDLRAANPDLNFDKLKPGDRISIPLHLIYPIPPPEAP